ncbi:pro-resilin-like [Palaemon carinicauda]|uniref:pro-resilin-like n=1 Tax=Palaemon carinicauda TaxID=392227 RepID=UPI0035B646A8
MSNSLLISLCLLATTSVLAYPQNGWQNGKQQGQGYTNGANGGNGANGANGGKQLRAAGEEPQPAMMPMNYDFQWEVNDEESSNFYGHKEQADNGRVDGSYHVWLPNGRLMKVEYYVEGNSGFVPKITYEDAYTPTWGTPYFGARMR